MGNKSTNNLSNKSKGVQLIDTPTDFIDSKEILARHLNGEIVTKYGLEKGEILDFIKNKLNSVWEENKYDVYVNRKCLFLHVYFRSDKLLLYFFELLVRERNIGKGHSLHFNFLKHNNYQFIETTKHNNSFNVRLVYGWSFIESVYNYPVRPLISDFTEILNMLRKRFLVSLNLDYIFRGEKEPKYLRFCTIAIIVDLFLIKALRDNLLVKLMEGFKSTKDLNRTRLLKKYFVYFNQYSKLFKNRNQLEIVDFSFYVGECFSPKSHKVSEYMYFTVYKLYVYLVCYSAMKKLKMLKEVFIDFYFSTEYELEMFSSTERKVDDLINDLGISFKLKLRYITLSDGKVLNKMLDKQSKFCGNLLLCKYSKTSILRKLPKSIFLILTKFLKLNKLRF